jgi:glycosyltransferase involved in cell wall biosynthesis
VPHEACPRASVVIPAYNAARTLPACLAALAQQTVPLASFETIVADDGSTDDTALVAAESGASRVLRLSHRGPAAARNSGIADARGEVILFTDADCRPAPDWLCQMSRSLDDPGVSGVKGSYKSDQVEVVARLAQCEFEERYDRQERLPSIDFVDSYAAAFRAQVLREVGGFNPAFPQANNEDVDLSYRLAERGCRLVFNRQAVVTHRHVASWRGYARLKARRGYWRMVVYRLHPGKALHDSYTPQLLKLQVLLVYLALGLALLAPLWPPLLGGTVLSLVVLLLTAWPFTRLVARLDRPIAPWAPCFVLVRACAFAAGVAAGLGAMLIGRPALRSEGARVGDG